MKKKLPKLSPRLQAAHDLVLANENLYDICCDHGYLGINAFYNKACNKVFLVDKAKPVTDRLKVEINRFDPQIMVIEKSGEELDINEMEGTALLMGIGSQTILNILSSWINALDIKDWKLKRLIFSSHAKPDKLESFLTEHNLNIKDRIVVVEKNRERQIWSVDLIC